MQERMGISSRFPEHFDAFPWAYYEVKDVNGVWHDPIRHTIPMVSVFGDNRLSKAHPDWVQIGPEGLRGTREARYFDWDTLCPSHDEVFETALDWVKRAVKDDPFPEIRLDDLSFARDGFCQCQHCQHAMADRHMNFFEYRQARLEEFIAQVRPLVARLELTVFPDPFPGHLERRFGLALDHLSEMVDRFVVPIYDMHYATTYWIEVLASAFAERMKKPWVVELYGLKVPEEALLRACSVALAYADGVVIAYDNQLEKLIRIKKQLGSA